MGSPFDPKFDKLVEDTLARWHAPSVSFAVVHNSDTWTKGYGLAQQDTKTPIDADTLFYAASTTKAQLCAAWGLYIASEANTSKPKTQQVKWSTPLANIIREDFVLSDPVRTRQVTLEDAVSHRTGLPRHELSYGHEGIRTPKDLTRNLRNLYFHTELRTLWEYCNTPFVAASHALETLTGKPLADYLREVLWGPLGMSSTYGGLGEATAAVKKEGKVLPKGTIWSKLPSDPEYDSGELTETDDMDFPEISGAGWVISSAKDYAKWMHSLLDPSSGPLTGELIKELWTPRAVLPPEERDNPLSEGATTYALGWFVSNYKGRELIWHPGGLVGAGSLVLLVPDLKWGLTIFANVQDAASKVFGLAAELVEAALDVPEEERTSRIKADTQLLDSYTKVNNEYEKAREKLFAGAPEKASVKHSLPIEAYAGTYENVGYGPLTFTAEKDGAGEYLKWDIKDRTWKSTISLRHVNAEHWMGTRTGITPLLKSALKATSVVGADGKAEKFGLAMEPAVPDTLTWFERVE